MPRYRHDSADRAICLRHDLFESLDTYYHLVHGEIPHEMEVDDKGTHMITEFSTSPNAATSKEASHLGNESWLGRHNLINDG